MIWFYRVISGFLLISLSGENREKFISLCARNGITLWNSRVSENGIKSFVSIRDYRLFRHIPREKGVKIHILKRYGTPFLVNRYRKRWGIAVGAVLFFALLQFLSGFIWMIDVRGNKTVPESEILSALQSIGITEGIRADSMNPKVQREKLLLAEDSLAWASLNIEGSRLTVKVSETKKQENSSSACNLKARSDGIIRKIDVVSGNCLVKVGNTVKKGDVLVSGILEEEAGTRFVRSAGSVYAQTENMIRFRQEFVKQLKIPTGKKKTKTALEIMNLKIPLYLGKTTGHFTEKKQRRQASLFGQTLPVAVCTKTFSFYREKEIRYSQEELKKILEIRCQKYIAAHKNENAAVAGLEYQSDKTSLTLCALVKSQQNIAFEEKIRIGTGN